MRKERDAQWAGIVSRQTSPAFIVKIKYTCHYSFSDLPFLVPEALMLKNGATLPAPRGQRIMTALLSSFFREYLQDGKQGALLGNHRLVCGADTHAIDSRERLGSEDLTLPH